VFEFEVEEGDTHQPSIHGSIWLCIRVAQHTLDVFGIDFDHEGGKPNEPDFSGS
jgi:hypothetical protein